MKKLLFMFMIVCFIPVIKQAHGANPMARQMDVRTNTFTAITPAAADLQTVLEWIDAHSTFSVETLITEAFADARYAGTAFTNTYTSPQAFSNLVVLNPQSITTTTGMAVTNTGSFSLITPTGLASTYTNVVSLASPGTAGRIVYVSVPSTATNKLVFTKDAVYVGSTNVLSAGDVMILIAPSTTTWVGK